MEYFVPSLFLKRFLISIIFIAFVSFSTACNKVSEHHDSFLIFGTIVNITLLNIDDKLAQDAFISIREDLKIMHRAWHVWEPSPLMRMNMLLGYTTEFSAAPSVIELFHVAKDLSLKSQHLFNPAIGKLIGLWGFHSQNQTGVAPSKKDILSLVKQQPTMQDISIIGVRAISHNASVKLDFGGVAKGFAIDRLLKKLKQKGINNALIDTGGDLKVIGRHGDRAWKIAIRDPRAKEKLIASIELKDNEAAFTSGDYERYLRNKKNNDQHLHHIIDPRTGYPATGTQSVTVLHNNASTADAAATALFIAGPKEWVKIAKAMNIKYVLLIDEKGDIHISSAMLKRVQFKQERKIVKQAEL